MKFKDYKYFRPDKNEIAAIYEKNLQLIKNANNAEEQIEAADELMKLQKKLYSMREIVKIRYAMNTADAYYQKEEVFWTEFNSFWNSLDKDFYQLLLSSKFIDKIKEKYSDQFFALIELSESVFSEKIEKDVAKENMLVSESIRFAAGNVILNGKEQPLPKAVALFSSNDREMRKKGFIAYENFFSSREKEFDRIYWELVKIRQLQAKKLGFSSYVEMAFRKRQRIGYSLEQIRKFREDVKKYIVPINMKIREAQRQRLGIDKLYFYDEEVLFTEIPKLKFTNEAELKEITGNAMENLGPKAHEYYEFMMSKELLDLYTRPNKALGGMAYFIPDSKTPFIETNLSGIPKDVEVYSHELGHAFQLYLSPVMPAKEMFYPASDACEVHSMAMEFFFWNNYDLYFEGDEAVKKQKYTHLVSCLALLAWCCIIDEFQEEVYSHEDFRPDDYKKLWIELEKKYLPYRYYGENSFFNKGTFWYKQLHLFQGPFYYIDYALAQTSALQLFMQINEDGEEIAWKNYLNICKIGAQYPYLEMIEHGNIKSPFSDGLIKELGTYAWNKLNELLEFIK